MLNDYIKEQILQNFAFSPTSDQEEMTSVLADFVLSQDDKSVGVLLGYAGTGKTSLVGAFVRTMEQMEYNCVLMAPTGRAAKVFSLYSEHQAYTIHKTIYRQKSILQLDSFSLGFNSLKQTLFIVDEASMIDEGKVLDDLIQFVYGSERHCRLLLVGDTAQLPPVGETLSPALQPDTLEMFGLTPFVARLEQVVRQSEQSGILFNATMLRQLIAKGLTSAFPQFHLDGFADIVKVPGDELIDTLDSCYARYGTDDTIVICRSNKRAVIYNRGIRAQILDYEDELTSRDMVMIAKNNYYWVKPQLPSGELEGASVSFLANGDICRVRRVRHVREFYGFRFADCVLALPDYDDYEFEATVLLDTLHEEAPSLTPEHQQKLTEEVLADYADIPNKQDRLKKLKEDPYFNALQLKYAYAVTCHKAQGGQWGHVFIDQGYMTEEMIGPDYYRWLYTAITRATEKVYLVNF